MDDHLRERNRRYLTLVTRILSREATPQEKVEFEALIRSNPFLGKDFRQVQQDFEKKGRRGFAETVVRVVLGTATPEESRSLESLKETDLDKWELYQDMKSFLEGLASCPDSTAGLPVEPMPSDVREELLKSLRSGEQ